MSERVSVSIPDEVDQGWLKEFDKQYGMNFTVDGIFPTTTAQVVVEDWLSQERLGDNSYRFVVDDELDATGWQRTIEGEIRAASFIEMPRSVGGEREGVLILEHARIVRPDGTATEIVDDEDAGINRTGTVAIRLANVCARMIELKAVDKAA